MASVSSEEENPASASSVSSGSSYGRNLQDLEDRSRQNHPRDIMTDEDASKLDLIILINRLEWRHTMNKLASHPKEARLRHTIVLEGHQSRGYPLHLAVSKKPPKHVVEALLTAYPEAIRAREEKWGRLPLHLACIFTASAQVLRALLDAYKESLRITDKAEGRLPIHYACLHGSPFEISLLVSAEQRALVFKDRKGKTPVDLAHESSNPHREAILKRLEDRTREVLHEIAKRMDSKNGGSGQYSQLAEDGRNQFIGRKSKSINSLDDNGESSKHAMARSMNASMSDFTSSKSGKASGVLRGSDERNSSGHRSVSSKKSTKSSEEEGTEKRGKPKGKSKTRKTLDKSMRKSGSRRSTSMTSGEVSGSEGHKTSKRKGGSGTGGGLGNFLDTNKPRGDDAAGYADHKSLGALHVRSGKKKAADTGLGKFLQARTKSSIGKEEDDQEMDHKSMGAKSLPAHIESSNNHIVSLYMFDDSGEISGDDDLEKLNTTEPGQQKNEQDAVGYGEKKDSSPKDPLVEEIDAELSKVDEQINDLDFRRQALLQEYENIQDSVQQKADDAERSRDLLSSLQRKLTEIQAKIEKEESALKLAETGIQLHKESLALHEIKVKAVDSEKSSLADVRRKILQRRQGVLRGDEKKDDGSRG